MANQLLSEAGCAFADSFEFDCKSRWAAFESWLEQLRTADGPLGTISSCGNPEYLLTYLDLAAMSAESRQQELYTEAWQAERDNSADATRKDHDLHVFTERPRDVELRHKKTLLEAIWYYFGKRHHYDEESPALNATDSSYRRFFSDHVSAGDVVVTFNYDTVAERCLSRVYKWSPIDGYGFIAQVRRPGLLFGGPCPARSPVKVLKLHGSYGWYGTRKGIALERGFLSDLGIIEAHHAVCVPSYSWEKLVLLPSFAKSISSPTMAAVWAKAARAFKKADEVVIVGYSLPPADSAAGSLLATSLRGRRRPVVVVDKAHELKILPAYKKVLDRTPIHRRECFGEWVDNGCPTLDGSV